MGDISKNFSRWEFKCKCGKCRPKAVDGKLNEVLEKIRNHFQKTVNINSGWRCEDYNKAEGGWPNSKHMEGIAADIYVTDIPSYKVYHYLNEMYPDTFGLGNYITFTHVDVRTKRARW